MTMFLDSTPSFTPNGSLIGNAPASLGERFSSAYDATTAMDISTAPARRMAAGYAPIVDELNKGKPYLDQLVNPYQGASWGMDAAPNDEFPARIAPTPFALHTVTQQEQEAQIWGEIDKRRQSEPNFLPGIPATQQEFQQQLIAHDQASVAQNEALADRSGFTGKIGAVAGYLAGGMRDPINLAALPIAGGAAKTLLGAALTQAGINAGLTALEQPAIAANHKELGFDYGPGDAALSIGSAGLIGLAFGAAGHGLGMLAAKYPPREILKAFDKFIPDPTPEQAAARTVLSEKVDIDAANPLTPTVQGRSEHYERLATALDALQNDKPLVMPDQPEAPISPEALAPKASGMQSFDPRDLIVDAKTFQFKEGGDEFGATDRLRGVQAWDPALSGKALVYVDDEGKAFIADGHQRVALARRLLDADPNADIRIDAVPYYASDGITPEIMRVIAARKNIAEGTGSPLDAAKIFRSDPKAAINLPSQSALVRGGTGLARLSDDAFGMAINGVVPAEQAAIVGRLAPNTPELHASYMQTLARTDPANLAQAESIVRQAIAAGHSEGTQSGLFGEEVLSETLFAERAKVLDKALKRIRDDRRFFATANRGAGELEAAGNQINVAGNAARAQTDAELLQAIDRLAYRKGPISDALTAAAKRAKDEGQYGNAIKQFLDEIRANRDGLDGYLADVGRSDGLGDSGGRSDGGAGRPDQSGSAAPDLFAEPGRDGAGDQGYSSLSEHASGAVQPELGAAASDDFFKTFDEPGGKGQGEQTHILEHDLKADLEASPSGGPDLADMRIGMGEKIVDGERQAVTKTVSEILEELDANDAALKQIEDCL